MAWHLRADPNQYRRFPVHANSLKAAFGALRRAAGMRNFWFLFATFFICGFTTNGLIGTHFTALCSDQAYCRSCGLPACWPAMGLFDLVGTTASGYQTDSLRPAQTVFHVLQLAGAHP